MRDLVVGKKCDNKKGFTLIELTIFLIIMSFLFAVAGPRIAKSLSGLSLATSTKKVAAALRYARSQAVNKSQAYSVIIDRAHAQVVIRGIPKPVTAPTLHEKGCHVVSTDEMTGIQALERLHPSRPMEPYSGPSF